MHAQYADVVSTAEILSYFNPLYEQWAITSSIWVMIAFSPSSRSRRAKKQAGNRNATGAMQHCAFIVTAERFRQVEPWLRSGRTDYIGPIPQLPGMLEAEQDKSRRAAVVDPLVDASSCSTTCPTAFGPFPYGLRRPCGR